VRWADLGFKNMGGTLMRNAGAYAGSDSGYFGGHCGSTKTSSTITISFHVVRAKAFGSAWILSRFVGTITQVDPAQLGCVAGMATLSITGMLTG
jgi:hypothetical protein